MTIKTFFENTAVKNALTSLIVLVVVAVFWHIATKAYKRFLSKKLDIDNLSGSTASVAYSIIGVVKFVVSLSVVLLIMQINGINVNSLLAGLGIFSAIVGLALQDYLKDVIMGFHILTDNYFRVGDVVKYGDDEGEVVSFTLRTTKIRSLKTLDMVTISNRNISEIARSSDLVIIDVPLSYEEDFRKVDEVLKKSCERIEELPDARKCTYKGTSEFDDSAILYKILFYCSPKLRGNTRRAALRILQEDLAEAGMSIPYSQLDVHLDEH